MDNVASKGRRRTMCSKYIRVSGVNSLQVLCARSHIGQKTMQRSTETPEQISPDSKCFSVTELSHIVRNDLYYSKTRYIPITIAGYDSITNSDSNGCTFEEVSTNASNLQHTLGLLIPETG